MTSIALLIASIMFIVLVSELEDSGIIRASNWGRTWPLAPPASARSVLSDARASPRTRPGTSFQRRSEEHTSELQSLMRISYAVFCLKKKKQPHNRAICAPQHTQE